MASRPTIRPRFALASRAVHHHHHRRRRRPALELLEPRVVLSTFTVNLTTDTAPTTGGSGSGLTGDMRYCIDQANANNQANTIVFDPTVFSAPQTITLGGRELVLGVGRRGAPQQTITGPAAGVTISGGGKSRVFEVALATASISGLTISGGKVSTYGGGIFNWGYLTLAGCTVSGSSASRYGGGIMNRGILSLTDCTVSGNSAKDGGGLYNAFPATLTHCTISGNSAINGNGGGLDIMFPATLTDCTLSGNSASNVGHGYTGTGNGGALWVGYAVAEDLTGCTISGNSAGNSGGGVFLYRDSFATLTDCTLSGNSAVFGGGGVYDGAPATVALTDCTLSGNTASSGSAVYARSRPASPTTLTGCTLSGNSGVAVLVAANTAATLTDCTISGSGFDTSLHTGLLNYGGTATLTDCTVTGNYTGLNSGAILYASTLTVTACTISGNSHVGLSNFHGTATLTDCTVTGNGDGLLNYVGTATLTDCTVTGNSVGLVNNNGTATLTDCTVTGNSVGLHNVVNPWPGTLTVTACTISGNSVGIQNEVWRLRQGALVLGDTIVAGNTASTDPDIRGLVTTDQGYNLIGDGGGTSGLTAASDRVGTAASPIDPRLAPLGVYGGPTPTMALLPGSPAIGQGAAMGQTTDQRGLIRGSVIDIGAVQDSLVVESSAGSLDTTAAGLTLPGAVSLADQYAGVGISFDPTVFSTQQTITLTAGQLELSNPVLATTITGPGPDLLSISGNHAGRVFQVDSGVTASLSGLTLSGGSAALAGGLVNLGDLSLTNCAVSGNSGPFAGGIVNAGFLYLTACTVSGNSAQSSGGGLFNIGSVTLTGCTLSGNTAASFGGALYNANGAVTLVDCTVSGNTALSSAGLDLLGGTAALVACTVSGNTGTSANSGYVAGIYILSSGTTTLVDTIVAGNTGPAGASDLGGAGTASGSYDLIGTGTVAGAHIQSGITDPGLAPLGDYGGPTQTMALLPGSPAIGQGAAIGLTTDQRGLPLDSPVPDIGAFQSQGFALTPVVGSTPQSTQINTAFSQPLELTVTANNPVEPVDGGVISFTAPSSGASAALSASTATIASGQAGVTAAANASAGSYTVITSAGGISEASFSLTNTAPPVTITPVSLLAGTAGVAYKQALSAAGGEGGPFTFAVITGELPAGFSLSSDGTLSGTDTTATTYTFTVTATGQGGFSGSQAYSLTINPASTSIFVVTAFPSPVTAGTAGTFTVTAQDAYGNTTPAYSGTVQFTSSDGQAVLPAKATLTSGTGSFSATLETAGTQAIMATDSSNGSITGTQAGITVNPALTSRFLVVGFPTPVTAGVSGSFTVTAKDAYGNTTPGYAGTVKFTSSDGQAALPANATLTNGTGSFTATLKTAGTQSITATDTVTSSLIGSQTGITVNPAAATKLSISGPSSVKSGTAFTITVTALDPYNNVAVGYRGKVHFTSSDPRAVLPTDYTFRATDGGAHTFTNGVTLKKLGTQTVTATDKATKSITGKLSISVSSAAPAALAVGGRVGGVTAIGPLPSDVGLGIGSGDDAAGAVAAGDGGVSVALGTGSGAIGPGVSHDIGVDETPSDDKLAALDAVLAAWHSRDGSGVEDGTA